MLRRIGSRVYEFSKNFAKVAIGTFFAGLGSNYVIQRRREDSSHETIEPSEEELKEVDHYEKEAETMNPFEENQNEVIDYDDGAAAGEAWSQNVSDRGDAN